MAIQPRVVSAAFDQKRVDTNDVVLVRPKAITVVLRIILIISGSLTLSILSVVVVAGAEAVPTLTGLSPQFLPGHAAPTRLHCGESAAETCYPPVDAHCFETSDDNCFITALIQQNGKMLSLTIDSASRTIIQTSGYSMGDLILAWGTPTGYSQIGRDINVIWGTRHAHLATCSFRPESYVEILTDYPDPVTASPWRGFVRVNSKNCQVVIMRAT